MSHPMVQIVGIDEAYGMSWKDLMKLMIEVYWPRNENYGNQTGNNEARKRAYALGGGEVNPDSNVVMGTFLLNNRYASILFDSSADRSFVSTTFSSLIDVVPTRLEVNCSHSIWERVTIQGDRSDGGSNSRLNISCTKTQKYIKRGCHVFLAQIMEKKAEDKSKEKRLEDVSIVRDFLEVFPEGLRRVPPA
ncbi:hypothetical protein Tco_0536788 [Tanacetum coccineum]